MLLAPTLGGHQTEGFLSPLQKKKKKKGKKLWKDIKKNRRAHTCDRRTRKLHSEFSMVRPKPYYILEKRHFPPKKHTYTHVALSQCSHTTQKKSTILEPYYSFSSPLPTPFVFFYSSLPCIMVERDVEAMMWLDEKLDLYPMTSSNFKAQSIVFPNSH